MGDPSTWRKEGVMRHILASLATLGVLLWCTNDAGARDSRRFPQFQRILVLPDTSGSLDSKEYRLAMATLHDRLPEMISSLGVQEVGFLPWAGSADALRSARWVKLPVKPAVPSVDVRFTEGESIFRVAREQREQREERSQREKRAAAEADFNLGITRALASLDDLLTSTPQGRAVCTDVWSMLKRSQLERPRTLCVFVTDADHDCSGALVPLSSPPSSSRVVVVLVPGRTLHARDTVDQRVRWLHRVAPWASVVYSFQTNGSADAFLDTILGDSEPVVADASFGTK